MGGDQYFPLPVKSLPVPLWDIWRGSEGKPGSRESRELWCTEQQGLKDHTQQRAPCMAASPSCWLFWAGSRIPPWPWRRQNHSEGQACPAQYHVSQTSMLKAELARQYSSVLPQNLILGITGPPRPRRPTA